MSRKMTLIPRDELAELARLASAAVKMHQYQTHYGRCDVCELVDKWRGRLDTLPVDVTGLERSKS